jgi:cell division protein FtsL
MANKFKVISGLSRKARFNITIIVILLFIIITIFASVNQVRQVIEKRKEITELEEELTWRRNENIKLLALEKSLYDDAGIELEARKQFNMAYEEETNLSIVVGDDLDETRYDAEKKETYSRNDLWGNIRLFYNQEINK